MCPRPHTQWAVWAVRCAGHARSSTARTNLPGQSRRHGAPGALRLSYTSSPPMARSSPGHQAGRLTEGGSHGLVQRGLAVAGGQVRARVVPTLVVVVLDVEAGELGEVDTQRTAGVVDVLPVQRLWGEGGERVVSGWGRCAGQAGIPGPYSPAWRAGRSRGQRTAAAPGTGYSW